MVLQPMECGPTAMTNAIGGHYPTKLMATSPLLLSPGMMYTTKESSHSYLVNVSAGALVLVTRTTLGPKEATGRSMDGPRLKSICSKPSPVLMKLAKYRRVASAFSFRHTELRIPWMLTLRL